MKIATIVGARPQFVKAAGISRAIADHNHAHHDTIEEVLVHTGQHYDPNLSQVFFDELGIPEPGYHLGVGSLSNAAQTGRMLEGIEKVLIAERPDWVLTYGDTNSTLAGALAARALNLRSAHVEAGLRSFNERMAEETNRVIADRISNVRFCPTTAAVENLAREGIREGVFRVGDVMYDVSLHYRQLARTQSEILGRLSLAPKSFILATVHRAENTDNAERLAGIVEGLSTVARRWRVVLAIHPRTRKCLAQHGLEKRLGNVQMIDPVSYLDMIRLEEAARVICTDSGGVQKEAYFFRVPCVTLRDETEWIETVQSGWNRLVGAEPERIAAAAECDVVPAAQEDSFYGDGRACNRIVEILN